MIRAASAVDLPAIAKIIAMQNPLPESHCIQSSAKHDAQAILSEMQELYGLDELRFVIAEADGQVVGCLGCEFERSVGRGWMRGPFLTIPAWERLPAGMLRELRTLLPAEICRLDSFLNQHNRRGQQFYQAAGFQPMSVAHVYVAEKPAHQPRRALTCAPLSAAQADSFSALHNLAFPETYIDGDNILRKLDPEHRVFVHSGGEALDGYVYVSIETHARAGFIEYLAVEPARRGQGIGLELLSCALAWCFWEQGVGRVALTVDGKLTNARRLYERAGFRLEVTGVNQRLLERRPDTRAQ